MTSAWQGNPDERVYDRVKKLGYSSVREFAEEKPTMSYVELAQELGDDVVGIQIEAVLADEYQNTDELVRFIKSNLVRCLNEYVSKGWGVGVNFDNERSSAYGTWIASFIGNGKLIAENAWQSLKNSPNLYNGWLPKNIDDPIINEVFKEA